MSELNDCMRNMLAPPHPTFRTRKSRKMCCSFIAGVFADKHDARVVNIGSSSFRLHPNVINLDLSPGQGVDMQGDIHALPFSDASMDAITCTAVLEHVEDAGLAVREIERILKHGGTAYIELPWMQGVHASPCDFQRWTPEGIKKLFSRMEVKEMTVAVGPASALAWQAQETLSMLFSFGSAVLYKTGLRLFGWAMVPLSWLDQLLEHHPEAWRTASGYAFLARKKTVDMNRDGLNSSALNVRR